MSGGYSSCGVWASHCGGFSCSRAWALGMQASVAVMHGLSCPTAFGIFWDHGSDLYPLHWQMDSKPWNHQGSPNMVVLDVGGITLRTVTFLSYKKKAFIHAQSIFGKQYESYHWTSQW